MVDEPVQDGGSDRVVVEDLSPVLERSIRRQDDRALFVAVGDDLEEQVASIFIHGQKVQLVDYEELWRRIVP